MAPTGYCGSVEPSPDLKTPVKAVTDGFSTAPYSSSNLLNAHNVNIFVRDEPAGGWTTSLQNLLPLILLAVLWFFMIRQLRRRQVQPQISNQPL